MPDIPAKPHRARELGGGTNLIVSDAGFDGVVLRFTGAAIAQDGLTLESRVILAGCYGT